MFRGWGWASGGGGGIGGGGEALKTWVRYMSRKRGENLRKINPKVPYPEATSIAQTLFNLVKDRGPLTISTAWTSAQEAGVSGLQSKTHMKIMLKWMRGKQIIKQICQQVGSNKKFLVCTPEDALTEQANMSTNVKVQTKKKSSKSKTNKNKKRAA